MERNFRFESIFETLSDNKPLRWQKRLFKLLLAARQEWPMQIDLPTGLGKTSIIHLWLIALAQQMVNRAPILPRRLVYVVDRRTVVDQATKIAEAIKTKLDQDPALLGIPLAVSTLRGQYADNREWATDPSRPAVIIGTVDMIGSRLLFSGYRSSYKWRPLDAGLLGQDALLILDEAHLSEPFAKLTRSIEDLNRNSPWPFNVMHMSATSGMNNGRRFTLDASDLQGDRDTNLIVRRYEAQKRLTIHAPTDKRVTQAGIIDAAATLASDGCRVVVFVRRPDDACKIAEALRKKNKRFREAIEILTGTMRGLERDELLQKPIMQRFLAPSNRRDEGPAILVATSAGEVGFDLNADHLVCDAAPLDSMIQRLGRVNRRGDGVALVQIFVEVPRSIKKPTDANDDLPKHTMDSAATAAVEALKHLPRLEKGNAVYDASPKALAALAKPPEALSPKPATVELTDILLDAWSMTTITAPLPGRPAVAPWLRGITEEGPQTTIAWRAELDIEGFNQLDLDDLEEWFDAHRILPHETLAVPTGFAASWLVERWKALDEKLRETLGDRYCITDRGGLRTVKLRDLISELEHRRTDSIRDADITLPASLGGIERGKGLLDVDVSEHAVSADIADSGPLIRHRELITMTDETKESMPLVGSRPAELSGFLRFTLSLPSDSDARRQLTSFIPKRERTEFGTTKQTLTHHVGLVEKHAREISQRLRLSDNLRQALELAATWHDQGKDRTIWQNAVGRKADEPPLAKSGGQMQRIPGDYRHEFGSMCDFIKAGAGNISDEIFDLALHLIAAHHGRGRPHFPKGGFDPLAPDRSAPIATDVLRRFARLQRDYGHWHVAWLENLLRCADALGSAEKEGQA